MARLHDLPNEIILTIVRHLPSARNKARFGQTCRDISNIAEAEIFRSIKIFPHKPMSAFSLFLAASRHGAIIKELTINLDPACCAKASDHCECERCWETDLEADDFQKDDILWQTAINPVLTLLRGTYPASGLSLETLNIVLPTDYSDEGYWSTQRQRSHENTCRRAVALLGAAAAHPASTITKCAIRHLPPVNSPMFETTVWGGFLSRLENFELSLCGDFGDDDESFATTSEHEARTFVTGLRTKVFQHLSSAKIVKIEASKHFMIGHNRSEFSVPLRLGSNTMPKLESLELVTTVVDEPLIHFLENRPVDSQPLNLTLTNCMCFGGIVDSEGQKMGDAGMKWNEVFDEMTRLLEDRKSPGIRSFVASFLDMNAVGGLPGEPSTTTQKLRKTLGDLMAAEPTRVLFPYVLLAEEYGYLCGDSAMTRDEALAGQDQAAYNNFIAKLELFSEELARSVGRDPA